MWYDDCNKSLQNVQEGLDKYFQFLLRSSTPSPILVYPKDDELHTLDRDQLFESEFQLNNANNDCVIIFLETKKTL